MGGTMRARDAGGDGVARREFLQRTGLFGLGAALSSRSGVLDLLTRQPAAATAEPVGPASLQSIEHVVILMQENRSYDHYFGAYPKGRGFDDHPKHSLGPFAQKDSLRRK